MKHGIKGLLAEDIIDLGAETDETLEGIRKTPAAALGSVRMKPTKEDFDAMVRRTLPLPYFPSLRPRTSLVLQLPALAMLCAKCSSHCPQHDDSVVASSNDTAPSLQA